MRDKFTFRTKYPNIFNVCDLFDITVMDDISQPTEHTAPCPMVDADGEGCTCKPFTVVYIGSPSDLNAGLYASQCTPTFYSLDELEDFCKRNKEKFEKIVSVDPEAPAPDATDWN